MGPIIADSTACAPESIHRMSRVVESLVPSVASQSQYSPSGRVGVGVFFHMLLHMHSFRTLLQTVYKFWSLPRLLKAKGPMHPSLHVKVGLGSDQSDVKLYAFL